MLLTWHINIIF